MSFFQMQTPMIARRLFLGQSSLLLSGAAVALLDGREALAANSGEADPKDVQILNTALGAELEAIAAYQLGVESKLLTKPVIDLAVTFQAITRSMQTCSPRRSRSSAASPSRRRATTTSPPIN